MHGELVFDVLIRTSRLERSCSTQAFTSSTSIALKNDGELASLSSLPDSALKTIGNFLLARSEDPMYELITLESPQGSNTLS